MTYDEAHAKLDEFRKLKANWDSYGAAPMTPTVIDNAHEFLRLLQQFSMEPPNAVTPVSDGFTLTFEWCRDGWELELDVQTSAEVPPRIDLTGIAERVKAV